MMQVRIPISRVKLTQPLPPNTSLLCNLDLSHSSLRHTRRIRARLIEMSPKFAT